MPQSSVLTVRLPDDDLKRLDALAKKRRQTRSQLVQETLQALLDNDQDQRKRELKTMQERLRPALEAQDEFLDNVKSFADEHRRF
jgi:predicted transcriptional regulator